MIVSAVETSLDATSGQTMVHKFKDRYARVLHHA